MENQMKELVSTEKIQKELHKNLEALSEKYRKLLDADDITYALVISKSVEFEAPHDDKKERIQNCQGFIISNARARIFSETSKIISHMKKLRRKLLDDCEPSFKNPLEELFRR